MRHNCFIPAGTICCFYTNNNNKVIPLKVRVGGSPPTLLETDSKQTKLNRRYFIVGERRLSNYWWASVIFLGGFGFLLTGISSYLQYNIFANFTAFLSNIVGGAGTQLPFEAIAPQVTTGFQAEGLNQNSVQPLPFFVGAHPVEVKNFENSVIAFFPQGLLMCFYGSLGLLLSIYWWLLIYWDIGGGFNEFNKKEGFMRIFRWGYPGKNRRIDLVYPLKDIQHVRVNFKQGGAQGLLVSEQTIYVRLLSIKEKNAPPHKELKEKRDIPLGGIGQPLTLREIEKQASELANYLQVGLE